MTFGCCRLTKHVAPNIAALKCYDRLVEAKFETNAIYYASIFLVELSFSIRTLNVQLSLILYSRPSYEELLLQYTSMTYFGQTG